MGGPGVPKAVSVTRLVVPRGRIKTGRTMVSAEAAHHAHVTRLRPGEAVELLDLQGRTGIGRLVEWHGRECSVEVERVVEGRGEPPAALVLALGVLHTDAFAWAVEKATELGATAVLPVLSARVQKRSHEDRTARWQRVADAAVAQCGRSRAPVVSRPVTLDELLATAAGCRFVADATAEGACPPRDAETGGLTVLVGPEGGLTPTELASAYEAGFAGLRIGPRTLRAETAATAALVLVQMLAGWL
jgi:16S rRNA (uracil1498-N3)-methyltransferase